MASGPTSSRSRSRTPAASGKADAAPYQQRRPPRAVDDFAGGEWDGEDDAAADAGNGSARCPSSRKKREDFAWGMWTWGSNALEDWTRTHLRREGHRRLMVGMTLSEVEAQVLVSYGLAETGVETRLGYHPEASFPTRCRRERHRNRDPRATAGEGLPLGSAFERFLPRCVRPLPSAVPDKPRRAGREPCRSTSARSRHCSTTTRPCPTPRSGTSSATTRSSRHTIPSPKPSASASATSCSASSPG